mgnify:CR=1 FL=1
MLYAGIALHKRTLAIHTVDAHGALVRKADLPTQRDRTTAYFAALPGPHRAVVECTLESGGRVTATCRGTFVAVKEGHPAYHRW